jgi:hypothetical protein
MLEYYHFKVIHDLFLKGQGDEACLQLKEMQKRYVSLCEENTALKAQVSEYEDIFYLARNFIFDGSFYWLLTGNIKQGPFCPNCYNQNGQIVRITDMHPRRCAVCGEIFEQPRQRIPKSGGGNAVRALEQSVAVNSLRSFTAMEQMDKLTLDHQEILARKEKNKNPKTKVIRFNPDFRRESK